MKWLMESANRFSAVALVCLWLGYACSPNTLPPPGPSVNYGNNYLGAQWFPDASGILLVHTQHNGMIIHECHAVFAETPGVFNDSTYAGAITVNGVTIPWNGAYYSYTTSFAWPFGQQQIHWHIPGAGNMPAVDYDFPEFPELPFNQYPDTITMGQGLNIQITPPTVADSLLFAISDDSITIWKQLDAAYQGYQFMPSALSVFSPGDLWVTVMNYNCRIVMVNNRKYVFINAKSFLGGLYLAP